MAALKILDKLPGRKTKTKNLKFWDKFCTGENADRAECKIYDI